MSEVIAKKEVDRILRDSTATVNAGQAEFNRHNIGKMMTMLAESRIARETNIAALRRQIDDLDRQLDRLLMEVQVIEVRETAARSAIRVLEDNGIK